MFRLRGFYHTMLQQKYLSATTSPLYVLKGPLRHVRSTAADLPLARGSLYFWPPRVSACSMLQTECCVQLHLSFLSAARLLMILLSSSVRHNCRRQLDAEGWRYASRNAASTPALQHRMARSFACFFRQLWNQKIDVLSNLACRKS